MRCHAALTQAADLKHPNLLRVLGAHVAQVAVQPVNAVLLLLARICRSLLNVRQRVQAIARGLQAAPDRHAVMRTLHRECTRGGKLRLWEIMISHMPRKVAAWHTLDQQALCRMHAGGLPHLHVRVEAVVLLLRARRGALGVAPHLFVHAVDAVQLRKSHAQQQRCR